MTTLRIALVLGTATGGIGVHARDLAQEFVKRGHEVVVAGPAQTEELFGFTACGAQFRPVQISAAPHPVKDATAIATLRRALRDVDVVHAHGVRAGALTGLALLGRRTPSTVTLHNAMLAAGLKARLLTGLERLAVRRARVALGASEDLVERARGLGARDARLGPVPAPPSLPPVRTREEVRAGLGLREQDGEALVLAVGRLAPQKDYPTLLRAADLWKDSAIRLAIAGDGPLRASAQGRIDADGSRVDLLGHRSDVADLLAAADVFVLTSTWEARALVVQEAMRAGVPVVATSVGGIPGLAGDAAVLVPAGDAEAIARAVTRLAADAYERASLAAAGRARAATWPDLDRCATDLVDLYAGLVAGR
ncbi:MAG TPA: glycosyltransferase [Actinocrinis sp.]|nr:glycosyltransferase [Actinocrinis sp.]